MINNFNRGEVLKADRLNQLVDGVNQNTAYTLRTATANPLNADYTSPFQMTSYFVDDIDDTKYRIYISQAYQGGATIFGEPVNTYTANAIYYNADDERYYELRDEKYDADYGVNDPAPITRLRDPVDFFDQYQEFVLNRYTMELHSFDNVAGYVYDESPEGVDDGQFIPAFWIIPDYTFYATEKYDSAKFKFIPLIESGLFTANPFQPVFRAYISETGALSSNVTMDIQGGCIIAGSEIHTISAYQHEFDWPKGEDKDHCIFTSISGGTQIADSLWDSVSGNYGYYPLYDVRVRYIGGEERLTLIDRYHGEHNIYLGEPTLPNFWVSTEYDPTAEEFKIRCEYGVVNYQNIRVEDALGATVPTFGGISLTDEPKVSWSGEEFVYVHQETDAKGLPLSGATVEMGSSLPGSTHHIPVSGQSGDYYWLIAQIEDNDGVPNVIKRHTGNIWIPNQLVEIENVGTGSRIYKRYDDSADKHELRTLVERYTNPSINISEDGDEVRIEGNNHDSTLTFEQCDGTPLALIDVIDGLVKIYTWNGSGWDEGGGTVVIKECDATTTASP